MKIYFSGAIFQKEKLGNNYEAIVSVIKNLGHTVFQDTTEVSLEEAVEKSDDGRIAYYKKVLKWIAKSDLVILEVSFPSTLHIGHELSLALDKGKPVVALYEKGREPSFFLGLEHERLLWIEYDIKSLKKSIEYSLDIALEKIDTRFNFFISPKIANYLDWMARKKRTPRAVYLRRLIEKDMKDTKFEQEKT